MKKIIVTVFLMAMLVFALAIWQPIAWQSAVQQIERAAMQFRSQVLDKQASQQNEGLDALDKALMRADARVRELDTGYGMDEALYARDQTQQQLEALRRELPALKVLLEASRKNAALEQHHRGSAQLIERSANHEERLRALEAALIEQDG